MFVMTGTRRKTEGSTGSRLHVFVAYLRTIQTTFSVVADESPLGS